MTEPAETDWEALYQANDTRWDKGAPSPGLVDFLESKTNLPIGTVCVPGCGSGHDVRAWAQAGFPSEGLDIAPSAIRLCEEKTRETGLPATFRLCDFLTAPAPRAFDWLFEHTLYCAIHPDRRDDYVSAVRRWLKPDGYFLAVHYLIPDQDGPPYGTTRAEVLDRFSTWFDLLEEWVPRSYPNRTNLEHMFWWQKKTNPSLHPSSAQKRS